MNTETSPKSITRNESVSQIISEAGKRKEELTWGEASILLQEAMQEIARLNVVGIEMKADKKYTTVANRLVVLRSVFGARGEVKTVDIKADGDTIEIKSVVY